MKRFLSTVSIMMLPIAAAAQKPPSVESSLKAELLNKTFQTKIALGNVLTTVASAREPAENRLVDTNVFPGGRIAFNVRDSLFFAPPGTVSVTCGPNRPELWSGLVLDGRLCQVKVGQTVKVDRLDLNDDRLEVWLSLVPEGSYAKLKFMFGKDWQMSMDVDAVMEGVSRGLFIESIERPRAVARAYANLQRQIRSLSSPSPSDPADQRLEQARLLRDLLNDLVKNRTEYEKLGKGSAAQETSGYVARVRELDTEIPQLEAEIKKNRLDKIHLDLSTARSEAAAIRSLLGGQPPKTLDELKAMENLLSQWGANLRHRDDLEEMLRPLGEQLTAVEIATRDQEREEVGKRPADLASLKPRLELAELSAAYVRMKTEENRLKAAYVSAFGTPRHGAAATQFRNHVQTMIDNRQKAQQLGESAAAVAAEIQRLRGQLAGIR